MGTTTVAATATPTPTILVTDTPRRSDMALKYITRSMLSSLQRRVRFFSTSVDLYCQLLHLHADSTISTAPSQSNLETSLSRTLTLTSPTNLHFSTVDSVLRHFPTSSTTLSSTNSPVLLLLLLRFFIWAGQQRSYRHSAAAYSKACDYLHLSCNPTSIIQLLDEYRRDRTPVSVRTFKIILDLCVQANLCDEAVVVLRRMGEFNCRPDTSSYNAVLRLLTKTGSPDGVKFGRRIMEEMALCGVRPDMVTYILMVKGLCGVSRFDDARMLVKQMPVHGCSPNVVIYSALIDGACRCGNLELAMEVMAEMEGEEGHEDKVNVVSYTCLIQCMCENGRVSDALDLLDRMVQRGCYPNRVTVTTILRGLCKEGRVDEGYKLVEKIVAGMFVPSQEGYSSLVLCLLQYGNFEEAETLVGKMLSTGIEPDGVACSSLIGGFCSAGRFSDGFRWVCELWKKGLLVNSELYGVLMNGLCARGNLMEAVSLFKGLIDKGLQVESSCLDSLVDILKNSGEMDLAMRILSMSSSGRRLKELSTSESASSV